MRQVYCEKGKCKFKKMELAEDNFQNGSGGGGLVPKPNSGGGGLIPRSNLELLSFNPYSVKQKGKKAGTKAKNEPKVKGSWPHMGTIEKTSKPKKKKPKRKPQPKNKKPKQKVQTGGGKLKKVQAGRGTFKKVKKHSVFLV